MTPRPIVDLALIRDKKKCIDNWQYIRQTVEAQVVVDPRKGLVAVRDFDTGSLWECVEKYAIDPYESAFYGEENKSKRVKSSRINLPAQNVMWIRSSPPSTSIPDYVGCINYDNTDVRFNNLFAVWTDFNDGCERFALFDTIENKRLIEALRRHSYILRDLDKRFGGVHEKRYGVSKLESDDGHFPMWTAVVPMGTSSQIVRMVFHAVVDMLCTIDKDYGHDAVYMLPPRVLTQLAIELTSLYANRAPGASMSFGRGIVFRKSFMFWERHAHLIGKPYEPIVGLPEAEGSSAAARL